MNVNYVKGNAVAFVAPDYNIEDGIEQSDYQGAIVAKIKELYEMGYRNFFTGAEQGFDLLAAEAVVMFREREGITDTNLMCYISNESQADNYQSYYRNLFGDICAKADLWESIAPAHNYATWARDTKRAHFKHACSAILTTADYHDDAELKDFLEKAAVAGMTIFHICIPR